LEPCQKQSKIISKKQSKNENHHQTKLSKAKKKCTKKSQGTIILQFLHLCVFPRHPRGPRFVAQEANSASFRAGFRRRLERADFQILGGHQYLWKSMGKIKILVSFISYRIMLWIYDSLSEFFFQMDSCLDVAYRIFRTNLYHYLWKGFSENDWLVRFSMDKIVGGPCVYLVGG
jgi:hypothetical protein